MIKTLLHFNESETDKISNDSKNIGFIRKHMDLKNIKNILRGENITVSFTDDNKLETDEGLKDRYHVFASGANTIIYSVDVINNGEHYKNKIMRCFYMEDKMFDKFIKDWKNTKYDFIPKLYFNGNIKNTFSENDICKYVIVDRFENNIKSKINNEENIYNFTIQLIDILRTLYRDNLFLRDLKLDNLGMLGNKIYIIDYDEKTLSNISDKRLELLTNPKIKTLSNISGTYVPTFMTPFTEKYLASYNTKLPDIFSDKYVKLSEIFGDKSVKLLEILNENHVKTDLKNINNLIFSINIAPLSLILFELLQNHLKLSNDKYLIHLKNTFIPSSNQELQIDQFDTDIFISEMSSSIAKFASKQTLLALINAFNIDNYYILNRLNLILLLILSTMQTYEFYLHINFFDILTIIEFNIFKILLLKINEKYNTNNIQSFFDLTKKNITDNITNDLVDNNILIKYINKCLLADLDCKDVYDNILDDIFSKKSYGGMDNNDEFKNKYLKYKKKYLKSKQN